MCVRCRHHPGVSLQLGVSSLVVADFGHPYRVDPTSHLPTAALISVNDASVVRLAVLTASVIILCIVVPLNNFFAPLFDSPDGVLLCHIVVDECGQHSSDRGSQVVPADVCQEERHLLLFSFVLQESARRLKLRSGDRQVNWRTARRLLQQTAGLGRLHQRAGVTLQRVQLSERHSQHPGDPACWQNHWLGGKGLMLQST